MKIVSKDERRELDRTPRGRIERGISGIASVQHGVQDGIRELLRLL